MIRAEVGIYPSGVDDTQFYADRAAEAAEKQEGARCSRGPMGTIVEADDIKPVLGAISRMEEAVRCLGVHGMGLAIRIDARY